MNGTAVASAPTTTAKRGVSLPFGHIRAWSAGDNPLLCVGKKTASRVKFTPKLHRLSQISGDESALPVVKHEGVKMPQEVANSFDTSIEVDRTPCLASPRLSNVSATCKCGTRHCSCCQSGASDSTVPTHHGIEFRMGVASVAMPAAGKLEHGSAEPDTAWGLDATAAILGKENPATQKVEAKDCEAITYAHAPSLGYTAMCRNEHEIRGSSNSSLAGTKGSERTALHNSDEETTVAFLEELVNEKGVADCPSSKLVNDMAATGDVQGSIRTTRSRRSLRDTFHDIVKGIQCGSWSTVRGMRRQACPRAPIPTFAPAQAIDGRAS